MKVRNVAKELKWNKYKLKLSRIFVINYTIYSSLYYIYCKCDIASTMVQ